ncbi:uncharacterized protein FPOAC1_014138 [Fusarium poae]|uniref:uncharacterized protein n=1 Tax=Fusarium poae TaxID=36050 RepID=UPI001D05658C|nr:uncharacterized protein FPOAC1_014138 [Fusarium poae]KAG8664071.1 hypothetical protein FPOAC1_014138 [Fusarium poae]
MDGPSSIEELTRLLREAEQRAEEERQRAEREQQRAEREQQRAEREQQRAEREQQRAEREQQRAEGAERERQEERQRAEREQQRAEEAEEHTRLTTLDEYIAACHDSVFSRFAIETDPKLTSKGPLTNPRNKPWPNFLHQQKVTFGTLHHSFPTERRLFENRNFLAGMGNRVSQRPIGDEKTLEYFLHNSVEDPVRAIVQHLKQVEEVGRDFQIGDGVVFENHPHALSDVAEEVVERRPHRRRRGRRTTE